MSRGVRQISVCSWSLEGRPEAQVCEGHEVRQERGGQHRGPACDLRAQALLVPEPGRGSWAHAGCGQHDGQGVPTRRWFELDMEGQAGRACGWNRVDARMYRGDWSSTRGWASGRPERAGVCKAGVPQKWKFPLRIISFDSQSLSLQGPKSRVLAPCLLRGAEPQRSARVQSASHERALAGLPAPRSLGRGISEHPGPC